MVRQSGCTFSNISIDYLIKRDFKIYIEYNDYEFKWTAVREDLHLYASDTLHLIALYTIKGDWAVKNPVPNYYKELIYGEN